MHLLNEYELRVLGALVEKQISTPDYYPLTLNGLTNACNQKNHRDPVVSYVESDVERALDGLRNKQFALRAEGGASRVLKFSHTFAKTYELESAEVAVLCVLMLRGPQTPDELRSRTAHLHNLESLAAVEEALQKLSTRAEPLVTKLPRAPGTKEARYAHLLGGAVASGEAVAVVASEPSVSVKPIEADRLAKLEAEVATLRIELEELKAKAAK
jgi:uncharacterized protein YceH (UPF0502 family)